MNIKIANKGDLEVIKFINLAFDDKEYFHSSEFFEEGVDGGRVMISYFDGKLVGYLIYQMLWGNTPFLALLRVLPEFRGKGLGRELVDLLCLELKEFEFLISSSELVNESGRAFHEKLGFVKIGELDMIFGKEVFYRKAIK